MEQERSYAFGGEEFALLFCRTGDHFAQPYLSPSAAERARKKLASRASGRKEAVAGSRLQFEAVREGVSLRLELRCELVEKSESGYCLSYLSSPEGDRPLERAVALLAGALLCRRRQLEALVLQRAVYDPWSGRMGYFRETIGAAELEEYFSRRIQGAFSFLLTLKNAEGQLRFPYASLREGQRELMDECYGCIKEKRNLFVCAPTGMGKTLSFLYPALKAVEKGKAKRVLFVTPKGSTQRQIGECAKLLEKAGGNCRSVILFARQSRCAHESPCLRGDCSLTAGHEERLLPALQELFSRYRHLDPENITATAREYRVCAFELSLLAARFCQVVVGDYNFVFDEKARLEQFCDGQGILLVDEAHNLPDRVRESRSYGVDPELCGRLRQAFPQVGEEILSALEAEFAAWRQRGEDGADAMEHRAPDALQEQCRKLRSLLLPRWDREDPEQRELLYTLGGFLKACADFEEGYVSARREDGGVKLCLADPARAIGQSAAQVGTAVYFSATLLPEEYFFSVLGGTPRDRFYQGESPFDPNRLLLCAAPLATTLANRGESLRNLCRYVGVACEKKGRYLMFFPSFEYLQRVEGALKAFCPGIALVSQQSTMSYHRRLEFFRRLEQGDEKKSLLGLCVLGGLFSEGVELKEQSLDGVIVVGTGMAPPSLEREAQCAYYARQDGNGKAFSYLLPGFHKVLQAVGRLIRKEEDRGFALLCDRRYTDGSYAPLYPRHWNEPLVCPTAAHLREILRRFWEGE